MEAPTGVVLTSVATAAAAAPPPPMGTMRTPTRRQPLVGGRQDGAAWPEEMLRTFHRLLRRR